MRKYCLVMHGKMCLQLDYDTHTREEEELSSAAYQPNRKCRRLAVNQAVHDSATSTSRTPLLFSDEKSSHQSIRTVTVAELVPAICVYPPSKALDWRTPKLATTTRPLMDPRGVLDPCLPHGGVQCATRNSRYESTADDETWEDDGTLFDLPRPTETEHGDRVETYKSSRHSEHEYDGGANVAVAIPSVSPSKSKPKKKAHPGTAAGQYKARLVPRSVSDRPRVRTVRPSQSHRRASTSEKKPTRSSFNLDAVFWDDYQVRL